MENKFSLGIDTSNYKTSVAITDCSGRIICNYQKFLDVKKGERGLRQSVALFQHVNTLPDLVEQAFEDLRALEGTDSAKVSCVCVSARPRPVEGSYMPVFNAGLSVGRAIAAALGVPFFETSHQEGHIEAVKFYSGLKDTDRLISFHFSGGTTEALLVEGSKISIIGGSRDIAFGQVLDRVGVAMGMEFPCGAQLDIMAGTGYQGKNLLPPIKCTDGYINLSGIETKCQRILGETDNDQLSAMIFERLGQAIADMAETLAEKYDCRDLLFAGGVSSSKTISGYLSEKLAGFNICFGEPALCGDNAVGTALIGGKNLWP